MIFNLPDKADQKIWRQSQCDSSIRCGKISMCFCKCVLTLGMQTSTHQAKLIMQLKLADKRIICYVDLYCVHTFVAGYIISQKMLQLRCQRRLFVAVCPPMFSSWPSQVPVWVKSTWTASIKIRTLFSTSVNQQFLQQKKKLYLRNTKRIPPYC